ncbi:hypothetical protein [Methylocystis echinoides]|uniref:hypothetical protein n=1 Tax=Methylocystis echinoides TaxID=29468 RepID=UPI003422B86F
MIKDEFPKIGEHKGVALHAFQSEARLAVVRGDIDAVDAMSDWQDLWRFAQDQRRAPEARMFAGAKLRVIHALAADARVSRPGFDLELLDALTCALDSVTWADPDRYGPDTDTDHDRPRRETPLEIGPRYERRKG